METATDPITEALARLKKLDSQLSRGLISQQDLETQRLMVLVDLLVAKS